MNFEQVNSCYYIQECMTTQIRFLKQRFLPNNRVLRAIEYVTTSNIEEPFSMQQNCHAYQIIQAIILIFLMYQSQQIHKIIKEDDFSCIGGTWLDLWFLSWKRNQI